MELVECAMTATRAAAVLKTGAGAAAVMRRLAIVVTAAGLAACQMQFVSDYDPIFDQQLVTCQQDIDATLSRLEAGGGDPDDAGTYAGTRADYARIDVELNGLATRAAAHPMNSATQDSVTKITHSVTAFEQQHRAAGTVSPAFAKRSMSIIDDDFLIVMQQELAKKHISSGGSTP